jgi:hypothetical protein
VEWELPVAARVTADEVLFDALLPPPVLPAFRDSEVQIEIIWGDDDAAVTNRFVRFSAPYERIDLDLEGDVAPSALLRRGRPATFVKTVPAPAATVPFERVWFDEEPSELEEPAALPKASWWWLVVSLLAGAVVVAYVATY